MQARVATNIVDELPEEPEEDDEELQGFLDDLNSLDEAI